MPIFRNFHFRCMAAALATIFLCTVCVAEELVVIVNHDCPIKVLTPLQVSDLYLGSTRAIAMAKFTLILDWPRASEIRKRFFQLIDDLSIQEVNAYWARLQFSGVVQPPFVFQNNQRILSTVANNPESIGYIEAAALNDSVRVILRLDHH